MNKCRTDQTKINSTNVRRYCTAHKNFYESLSIHLIIITDNSIHWESYIILKIKYIIRIRILNELFMFFDIHKDSSTNDVRNGLFVSE